MSDYGPNTFVLMGDVYSYYEDDSTFEEDGARQTEADIFEVIGAKAHISVIGSHLPIPSSLEAAAKAVIDAGTHAEVGETITKEDLAYQTIETFFRHYTMAEAIVIHP